MVTLQDIEKWLNFNQQMRNTEYPMGTIEEYEKLVASLDKDCTESIREVPVEMASHSFATQATCELSKINNNYGLLHELIRVSGKPYKYNAKDGLVVAPFKLSGSNTLFAIKAQDYNESLSEYLVARYGTNPLRILIPNFALVYALFNGSKPVATSNEVGSWCWDDKGTGYIVYENIKGITMREFARTANASDVINCLLQVFLALCMANKFCDFIHYDLHTDNVMVVELPEERIIHYAEVSLSCKYVAVIIDYGFAHINHNGMAIGRDKFQSFSIYYDSGNPMYDVYRLLTALLYGAPRLAKELKPMWNIIVSDDPSIIEPNKHMFLSYQLWNEIPQIDDFIKKALTLYPKNIKGFPMSYPTVPYVHDTSYYLDFINATVNQVSSLDYYKGFRNAETTREVIQLLTDNNTVNTYAAALVNISRVISNYLESLYYLVKTGNNSYNRIFVALLRRINTVLDVIKDDAYKIKRASTVINVPAIISTNLIALLSHPLK